MWKFKNFFVTLILREINFGEFRLVVKKKKKSGTAPVPFPKPSTSWKNKLVRTFSRDLETEVRKSEILTKFWPKIFHQKFLILEASPIQKTTGNKT